MSHYNFRIRWEADFVRRKLKYFQSNKMSTGKRVKSSIPKGRCHGDKGLSQGHGVEVSIELNSERSTGNVIT